MIDDHSEVNDFGAVVVQSLIQILLFEGVDVLYHLGEVQAHEVDARIVEVPDELDSMVSG